MSIFFDKKNSCFLLCAIFVTTLLSSSVFAQNPVVEIDPNVKSQFDSDSANRSINNEIKPDIYKGSKKKPILNSSGKTGDLSELKDSKILNADFINNQQSKNRNKKNRKERRKHRERDKISPN